MKRRTLKRIQNLQPFPEKLYCSPGWGFHVWDMAEQEEEEQDIIDAEEDDEEHDAADGVEELRASM